jgi:tetratricopeptide (TPR) repeat protein
MKKIFTLLILLILGQIAYGQSNKEQALTKAKEAITLMDNGNIDESIKLLEEAQKLDPKRIDYPYEIAFAYYLKEDYQKTIDILNKYVKHQDVTERLFQLLGNSYDMIGETSKAIKVYDNGIKKFPNSGMIYLEKGNLHWDKKEYSKALPYYEKGIEVAPNFSSNYYRAAKIYCNSTEEVWGMIYGEIFMNLESNSDRTIEISKLLFDTYKSEIKFVNDSSVSVSFCQQMIMDLNTLSDSKNLQLPFCMIYEPTLLMSIVSEKNININSLDRIRKNFIENYYKMGYDKIHPNVLFEYQNKINEAGHLETYNHWILMKGDEDGFDTWLSENEDKWDRFVDWFTNNALKLNNNNKFYK